MKIGILKTDAVHPELVSEFGEYPEMFAALLSSVDPALVFVTYDVEQGDFPDDIDAADAYLITGSKSSVYEDKPWIKRLMQFVRELHARRKKLVGICFGHQLVAQALGGATRKSSKGWGVGVHTHRFATTPWWHDGDDAAFTILVSHQDQVEAVAEGVEVLAGSEFCENAVTQVGNHILTFQGHPEFVPGYARALMESRRELIGDEAYTHGIASLAQEHQGERVARWVLNFLQRDDQAEVADLAADTRS